MKHYDESTFKYGEKGFLIDGYAKIWPIFDISTSEYIGDLVRTGCLVCGDCVQIYFMEEGVFDCRLTKEVVMSGIQICHMCEAEFELDPSEWSVKFKEIIQLVEERELKSIFVI